MYSQPYSSRRLKFGREATVLPLWRRPGIWGKQTDDKLLDADVQVNDSPKPGRKFGDGPSEVARSIKERIDRDAEAAQHAEQIQRWDIPLM